MSLLFFQRPPTATAKPRKCAHVSQNLLKNPKRGLKQLFGPKKNRKEGIFGWRATETSRFGAKNPPENGERPRGALLSTKIALKIPSRHKKNAKRKKFNKSEYKKTPRSIETTKSNAETRRDPPRPAETHRDPSRPIIQIRVKNSGWSGEIQILVKVSI